MGYQYQEIEYKYEQDYLRKLDKIEKLKHELKITETQLNEMFKADNYNSIAIEGNQLKREEITYLLETEISIRGINIKDYLQAKNYSNALDVLKQCLVTNKVILSADFIKWAHHIITNGELPVKDCGQFRTEPVHIRTTTYIPPMEFEIEKHIDDLCDMYYRPLNEDSIFERICEFKRNFERIHPFVDGNGRTGRFLMNLLFLQNGYGFVTIPVEERNQYFQSIEDNTFNVYMSQKMLESMEHIKNKYYEQDICL